MMRGAFGGAVLVSGALISFSSAFHIQRPTALLLQTPRAKRTQSSATIEVTGEAVERGDEEVIPFREKLRDDIERPNGGEQEVITIERSTREAVQSDDVQAAKNDEKLKGSSEAVQVEQAREGEQEMIAIERSTGEVARTDGVDVAIDDKVEGSPEAGPAVEQPRERDVGAQVSESTSAVVGDEPSPPAASTVATMETKSVPDIAPSPNVASSRSIVDIEPSQSSQPEEIGKVMTRSDTEAEKPSRVQVEMIEITEETDNMSTRDSEEAQVVTQVATEPTESPASSQKDANEENTPENTIESVIPQDIRDRKSASDDVTTQPAKMSSEPEAALSVEEESESPESLPSPTSTNDQTTESNPLSLNDETVIKSSAISQDIRDRKSASDDVATQPTKKSSELQAAPVADVPVKSESQSPESLPSPTSMNDQTTEFIPLPSNDETAIKSSAISRDKGDMKSASDDVATQPTKKSSELQAAPVADMPVKSESESLPLPTAMDDQATESNSFSWSGGKVMDMISGKVITLDPAPTSIKETQYLTQQVISPFSNLSVPSVDLNDPGALPILIGGITFMLAIVGFASRQTAEAELVNDGQEGEGEPSPISKAVEKTKNLVQKVKEAGPAGAISYALWEALFWVVSIPLGLLAYATVEGRWLDLTDSGDLETFGFACFCYANIARLALPLRIGIALSTAPWVQENILDKFEGEPSENVDTSILNRPVADPLATSPPTLASSTPANGDEIGGTDQGRDSSLGSSREPLTKTTTPLPAFGLSKTISSLSASPDLDGERTPLTQAMDSTRDEVTASVAEIASQSDKIAEEMLDSTRRRSKTNDDGFSRPNGMANESSSSPSRTESPLQRESPLKVDSNRSDEISKPQTASSLSSQITDSSSNELASEMLDASREKVTAKVNGGSTFIMPNRRIDGDDSSEIETESPIGEDDPWTAIAKSQESYAIAKANKALSSDAPNGADSDIVESYKSASSFGGFNDRIFNGQSKPATSDKQPNREIERNTPAIAKRLDLSSKSPSEFTSMEKSPKDDTSNVNGENEAITAGDAQEETTRVDEADDTPPLSSLSQASSTKGLSVNGSSGVDLSPIPASFAAVDSQIQESALSKKVFDIDPSTLAKKREPIIELEEYW